MANHLQFDWYSKWFRLGTSKWRELPRVLRLSRARQPPYSTQVKEEKNTFKIGRKVTTLGDKQPLLGEEAQEEAIRDEILQDLLAGNNFRHVIENAPDRVVRLIGKHGVKQIAEFSVLNDVIPQELMDGGIETLGSDDPNPPNIKELWQKKLKDPTPDKDAIRTGWKSKIKVEAHVVQIKNAADAGEVGILHALLMRYKGGLAPIQVFGLPAVQSCIHYKWNAFARHWLMIELAFFVVWLGSFCGFAYLLQDEDVSKPFSELFTGPMGIIKFVLDILMLVGMAPFLLMEVYTITAYGLKRWFSVYNLLDMMAYVAQIAITTLHLTRTGVDSHALTVVIAIQAVVLWAKLTYFVRAFNFNTAIDTLMFVIGDVSQLLIGIFITLFSFATAFYVLFRQETDEETGKQPVQFETMIHCIATMFQFLMGGFEFDVFWGSNMPMVNMIFFLAYEFSMAVILFNVVTAAMEVSWDKFSENEAERFQLIRCELIDELETFLPDAVVNIWGGRYPDYVHVLKVQQSDGDQVDGEDLWTEANRTIVKLRNDLYSAMDKLDSKVETRLKNVEAALDRLADKIR